MAARRDTCGRRGRAGRRRHAQGCLCSYGRLCGGARRNDIGELVGVAGDGATISLLHAQQLHQATGTSVLGPGDAQKACCIGCLQVRAKSIQPAYQRRLTPTMLPTASRPTGSADTT